MFEHDVAVVGAGRIGLPWAAVLAADLELSVTCIDVDDGRVVQIERGDAPFAEPHLQSCLDEAVESNRLQATTATDAVEDHEFVAFTMNALRNDMAGFLEILEGYAEALVDGQTVVVRTTLPVDMVRRCRRLFRESDADVTFTVFPERLAEGRAIEEIRTLPKVVGADGDGDRAIRGLLEPFGCPVKVTDPETAMFVKLIDNAYRDAVFAIANQIAYTADQLELEAHEAIQLANFDYPRNDIPGPGTVGGKCLPKDPHFLTDERVCDQPTTPDLFNATRRTNASLPGYIVTQILRRQPSSVAVLGLSYKRDVGDTFNAPAKAIADSLSSHGVDVRGFEPNLDDSMAELDDAISDVGGVVLAVNHSAFEGIEPQLNEQLPPDGFVYDVWGVLDESALDVTYSGFGIRAAKGDGG